MVELFPTFRSIFLTLNEHSKSAIGRQADCKKVIKNSHTSARYSVSQAQSVSQVNSQLVKESVRQSGCWQQDLVRSEWSQFASH